MQSPFEIDTHGTSVDPTWTLETTSGSWYKWSCRPWYTCLSQKNKQHNTTVECGVELQRVLIHPEARRCENRWHLNKCITAANAKHSAVVRKQKRKIALSLKGWKKHEKKTRIVFVLRHTTFISPRPKKTTCAEKMVWKKVVQWSRNCHFFSPLQVWPF